jgi:DMSO/TMAO reductase YedYZ molybdopterin-dependent catalytic subunit
LTLDDIKAFPQHEMITELKCIEGWSSIIHWRGPRLSDILTQYQMVSPDHPFYVGMETPDGEYYVGIDGETAMHPQTLLAYEKNYKTLTQAEGFPLRLATPLKYGIKNIKRVSVIRVSEQRPRDFWAERSYDYYAGH